MRLLPPVVFTLATTVLVLTVGGGLFGWETSLLTPLSLLTVSLILLQRAEPAQPIPGPSVLALSVIGLGLAIALLGYGFYSHDAAAAVNLPAAGVLLYVIISQYARRQRKPAPQTVFVTTPEAPLAEIGNSLPQ